MDSACGDLLRRPGSPIRASADRSLFAGSPRLFAGSCALRRLLPPRHPPCALVRLAIQPQPAWPGRTRLLSTSLRFLHSLFLSYAGASATPGRFPRQASPPRPRALPELLKSPAAPGAAARPSPTRKRTRSRACGSPPPSAVFGATPAAPAFCFVTFISFLLDLPCLPPRPASRGRLAAPPPGVPWGKRPAALWWSQGGSNSRPPACKAGALPAELWPPAGLVGLGGIEPPTSPLSGVRSNQLSYRPESLGLGLAGQLEAGARAAAGRACLKRR